MKSESQQVKICYVLLCHKQPDMVIEQIEYLVESGAYVVYHLDGRSPKIWHQEIAERFKGNENVTTVSPIKAGWGDWSLTSAALRMLEHALKVFPTATHFYHLSGDCLPIRPAAEIEQTLAETKADIIETVEFYDGGWIKTGPHVHRVQFYHFFNERKYKWLFYRFYDLQRLLRINRTVPEELAVSIGSQWWCLRRKTIKAILFFLSTRPQVVRFFKRTWIPDEIFFQTLVASLVPEHERISKPPTFLRFSDYGFPSVFHEDHFDFLIQQDRFFARKISGNAMRLRKRLVRHFLSQPARLAAIPVAEDTRDVGIETMNFLINAGRNGNRFGPRIWEKYSQIDGDRRVYLIIVKKWHVGNRIGTAIEEVTGIPYVGYVFDEHELNIQGLGNFEKDVEKRRARPSAYLRTLMEVKKMNEVIVGIDTSRFEVVEELSRNTGELRIIEIENEFDEEYLEGHAQRLGLIGAKGVSMQKNSLNVSLLETLDAETRRIRAIKLAHYDKVRDWHSAKLRAEIYGKIFEREPGYFLKMARQVEIRD